MSRSYLEYKYGNLENAIEESAPQAHERRLKKMS